ncbi:MAG: PAS domain-containing sensor histidine kinase [Alphaproteobacteria bacterium]|nr:PAS domain-containing sensor histidine kinase [Alphaproteobacteria bacterium]
MMLGDEWTRLIGWVSESDLSGVSSIALGAGLGLLCGALAYGQISQRRRQKEALASLQKTNSELQLERDRLAALLLTDAPLIVTWTTRGADPALTGDQRHLAEATGGSPPLAFGQWLAPKRAQSLDAAIDALRRNGTPFELVLQTKTGRYIEAQGRPLGGRAVMRLKDVSSQRQDYLDLARDHENLKAETLGLRAMLDTLAQPIWLRDRSGRLSWVNEPYAFAVDAENSADAIARQIELLDAGLRKNASESITRGDVYQTRSPLVIAGERRIFDLVETPLAAGSIGYASDISDLESIRSDLERQMANHVRTLDQLPTSVAIFDEKQKLVFCNLAYRTLWQLDEAFIKSMPTDGEILDRLRDARRLPEQVDYKGWKAALLENYRQLETRESVWYLPGGRMLRAVINPNPQGGVTYLFDDVTAQFHLQSSFNALTRVQSETLDSLKEGVAVFGTDGRHKFNNPAFEKIWSLDAKRLETHPHIDQVILDAHHLYADVDVWSSIKGMIAGVTDSREAQFYRMERHDGSIVDCTLAPLPDGSTLVTFIDVSAIVNVERALTEKNEALERAAKLRENFVHHVSYQLRSPLTNVIGFTELLASGTAGPLTNKQSDYAGHILQSSHALMAIIDDILDLASFDRGEIDLSLSDVELRPLIDAAVMGLKDQMQELGLDLNITIDPAIGIVSLDEKRIRQILFNLLSNAIGFSDKGQTISVAARLSQNDLVVEVRDEGRGIPSDLLPHVFDRFETRSGGTKHRGAGLGLSLVKALVELHSGHVTIDSEAGRGTLVTCHFPQIRPSDDATKAA